MVTIERPSTGEERGVPRHRSFLVVLIVVVLVAVGAVVWMMTNGESEKSAIEEVQDLAAAMRDNDIDTVVELLALDPPYRSYDDDILVSGSHVYDLVAWSMAVQAEPTLTACTSTPFVPGIQLVECDVSFGQDYFYAQALDETLTARFAALVHDEDVKLNEAGAPARIQVIEFGGLSGDGDVGGQGPSMSVDDRQTLDRVYDVEVEFAAWVGETRPELYSQLWYAEEIKVLAEGYFGWELFGPVRNQASGVLRMELLDDFLAS